MDRFASRAEALVNENSTLRQYVRHERAAERIELQCNVDVVRKPGSWREQLSDWLFILDKHPRSCTG